MGSAGACHLQVQVLLVRMGMSFAGPWGPASAATVSHPVPGVTFTIGLHGEH